LRFEHDLEREGYSRIAGADEAGRGPLAGPVVAAAVILTERSFSCRIDDSKKLSPLQRERAFQEIITKAHVSIGVIDERVIDRINIYAAARRAIVQAVTDLPLAPDYVLIDGTFTRIRLDAGFRCIPHGDARSLSIAAASIVAKVVRDRIMDAYHEIFPAYDFRTHKGYPTARHIACVKQLGRSPFHRRSFMKDIL